MDGKNNVFGEPKWAKHSSKYKQQLNRLARDTIAAGDSKFHYDMGGAGTEKESESEAQTETSAMHNRNTLSEDSTDPVNNMERRLNKLLMQTENPNAILLHYAIVGEVAAQLFSNGAMTDISIICQDAKFYAHKSIVACHSEYFAKLLAEENEKVEIILNINISSQMFKHVLRYMYTGMIEFDVYPVIDVLIIADRLKIVSLLKRCKECLDIKPENCISIITKAEQIAVADIYNRAYNYLIEHFLEIVACNEFLHVTVDKMCEYISNEEIFVRGEMDVFRAAIRWLQWSDHRMEHAENVMGHIKFILLSPEDLVKCVEEAPQIMDLKACKAMLFNANWYHTCERVNKSGRFKENIMGPRKLLIEL